MQYSNVIEGEEFVINITKAEVTTLQESLKKELDTINSATIATWKANFALDLHINPKQFINTGVVYSWKFKEVFDKYLKPSFTKGMIFDLHQDGESTIRVIALSEYVVMNLETGETLNNIDSENELGDILIDNIFTLKQ